MGKSGFALPANRHQAPGNAHIDALALQLFPTQIGVICNNLWDGMCELEPAGIALLSESFNLF